MHIYQNDFGLFGDDIDKKIRLWGFERESKYLLAHKYIPSNFDALLIGPSFSDMGVDTSLIASYATYNLSIGGANISELSILVKKIAKRKKLKAIIICIDPWVFLTSGKMTSAMTILDYFSSVGSLMTIKIALSKIKKRFTNNFNLYDDSWSGYRLVDPNETTPPEKIKESLFEATKEKKDTSHKIDPTAFEHFKELVLFLRNHNVKIMGYYHPRPYLSHEAGRESYIKFQQKVSSIFNDTDCIWDFNQPEYHYFTKDYSNYSDISAHLSIKGGKTLSALIAELIDKEFRP